jgi:predicted ABC-type ATPase
MARKKYPLLSSPFQLQRSTKIGNLKIRKGLSPMEFGQLKKINSDFFMGKTSLKQHSIGNLGRQLTPRRQRFHNQIINRHFKDKSTIDRKDPDIYILGGIAGSGKTEVLVKRIPEQTTVIDNDSFKERLAKRSPSPIPRLPLAHSPFLHDEAAILVQRSIERARGERRNITLDKTFKTFEKGRRTIQNFKDAGYDVHFLGTQKKPHQTIENTSSRFLKKGRYVPPQVIRASGNQTSKNVLRVRKLADTHQIYDTTVKGDPKLIFKSKKNLDENFRDP